MNTEYNKAKKEMITTHSLGQAKERHGDKIGERILTISTYKYGQQISTNAKVSWHGDGVVSHCFSFAGDKDGDFSITLQKEVCPRATEKVIRAYHAKAEPLFEGVLSKAREHYNAI